MEDEIIRTVLPPHSGHRGMTFAITKDLNTEECLHNPLNSIIVLNKVGQDDVMFLVNGAFRHNTRIQYKVKNVDGFFGELLTSGFMAIRFTDPRHLIVLYTPCLSQRIMFLEWFVHPFLNCMIRNRDSIILDDDFDPKIADFMSVESFDRNTMLTGSLSTIVLEGIDLPFLPENFGDSPISYISISKSTLGLTNHEPQTFWDWMTKPTIGDTLEVLEMNSNDLRELPFELLFLKNLTVLSVSKNKLTFIPHLIGELKKLHSIFIDNNYLKYLPESLQTRTFQHVNYSDNDFGNINYSLITNKNKEVSKNPSKVDKIASLSQLSLFCLINNNVHFKRQDLSLAIIKGFDKIFRCSSCHKLMIAGETSLYHISFVKSKCFVLPETMNWQYFKCTYNCIDTDNLFPYFHRQIDN